MHSQDIRLRLLIRRHALPEVKLLWPCSCSEDLTVARLLEQVNEVVPLESGEWGLEDYAVELADGRGGTFECLHFQQVGRVLKDEDQVLIRSLLTGDLKRRQLSGRHQISDDGRHLVDGLAFGRPWLRTPRDRPQIALPPRKRARIEYNPDDDEEEEEEEQLLLEAPQRPRAESRTKSVRISEPLGDEDGGSEDNYDDSYGDSSESNSEGRFFGVRPASESSSEAATDDDEISSDGTEDEDGEDEDLEEELRYLKDDTTKAIYGDSDHELAEESLEDNSDDDDLDDLEENLVGEAQLLQRENKLLTDPTKLALHLWNIRNVAPVPSPKADGDEDDEDNDTSSDMEEALDSFSKALLLAYPSADGPEVQSALVRAGQDARKAYMSLGLTNNALLTFDQMAENAATFFSSHLAKKSTVSAASVQPVKQAKPNTDRLEVPGILGKRSRPLIEEIGDVDEAQTSRDESESSDSDTSNSSSELEEEAIGEVSESSSDDDSDDDSSSSGESQVDKGVAQTRTFQKDGKSSSKESSSDGNVDPESNVSYRAGGKEVDADESSSASESSSESSESDSKDSSDSDSDSDSESEAEPDELPSKPSVSSAAAQKQPVSSTSQEPSIKPLDPSGSGLTRTQKRNARRRRNKTLQQLQDLESEHTSGEGANALADDLLARKQALLASILNQPVRTTANAAELTEPVTEEPLVTEILEKAPQDEMIQSQDSPIPEKESPKRRNRFDMGAGRRLLFGALGLKAPKTKADEQNIRENLMKDVRPLQNHRIEDVHDKAAADTTPEHENPDWWREKITYRAVECCHYDMELSEPPFPFVQRWDPQQKYDSMRKRKRASEIYDAEASYLADSSYCYESIVEQEEGRKKKKNKKNKKANSARIVDEQFHEDGQNILLNYDDTPAKNSQFTDIDDLPSLPVDLTTLPVLESTAVKPGMVITWKQLLMSKATKWQPEVVSITGLVIPGGEGSILHVMLAQRDREVNEKLYDENTGQRVYDKFEVPDLDDVDEEEDTGFRELQWSEMIEPRLLQHEPTASTMDTPLKRNNPTTKNGKPMEEVENVEVSDLQNLEDALATQLSREQGTAAVEENITQASLHDSQDNTESFSIQSGQQMPRPEFLNSGDEIQVSTASDSWEVINQKNSDSSKTAETPLDQDSVGAASPEDELQASGDATREDRISADQEAELGSSLADAVAGGDSDSDGIASKQSPAQASDDDDPASQEIDVLMADESNMIVPSSPAITGSGRQLRGESDMAKLQSEDEEGETVIPETLPQWRDATPVRSDTKEQRTTDDSSSPFPSVEEIFMTARQTQSPGRGRESLAMSQEPRLKRDIEYEEAMQRLDEGHESDQSPGKRGELKDLFPNATQPVKVVGFSKEDSPSRPEGPSKSKAKAKKKGERSPFLIPRGSQVIVLSSSSPSSAGEPEADNIDEGAGPRRNTLPAGPGWVRKGHGDGPLPTGRRRRSVPARTTTAATNRSRREDGSPSPSPVVSALRKSKGPKRRSLRQAGLRN